MSVNDNVTSINVPPKRVTENYHNRTIVVTYIPATRLWRWEFIYTATFPCEGFESSLESALKAARKQVDKMEGVK